jgi:hypothetical protein
MEVSVQTPPGAFPPSTNSRDHLIGGWVDHRAGYERNNVTSIAAQNPVLGNCEHSTKPSTCREGEKVFGYLVQVLY